VNSNITDEIERLFRNVASVEGVRGGLEAVQTELCAQEPGRFVLTKQEEHAVRLLRQGIGIGDAPTAYLLDALGRALRTIGPQPAQCGEWSEQDYLEASKALTSGEYTNALDMARDALNAVTYRLQGGPFAAQEDDSPSERDREVRQRVVHSSAHESAHSANCVVASYRREIESGKPLAPVAQELSSWERRQIEAFRATVKNKESTKGEMLLLLDRAYPKRAPVEAVDEVKALLAEMTTNTPTHRTSLYYYASKLEVALAARDAKETP